MKTYNMCKRMDKQTKIAINRWSKRLEADIVIIHKDGSVTLTCEDGIICDNYTPTAKDLYCYKQVI